MGFMYQQANLNIPYILSQVRVYRYLAAKEGHTFLTKIPPFWSMTPPLSLVNIGLRETYLK